MDVNELRQHATELGFTPQDEVRWLSPGELSRTAVQVGFAAVFSNYWDKRELQAALPQPPLAVDPDPDGGCWVDFVADLGDGFDATYTVAGLVAADALDVDGHHLPRGSLLVLGGDEVYPVASAAGYDDRFKGPYRMALPEGTTPAGAEPQLVALPGNHDWYDGLTAFLRVFGQRRRIGGWRTTQSRSYFAVQLPGRWWVVGLDTQLGSEVDDPQRAYFRENLSAFLQPGDAVVICSASPTWLHANEGDPDAFNTLHWFDRHLVRTRHDPETGASTPTGASVRLWVTGDRHHYAHYVEDPAPGPADGGPRHLVTCGLGGAYLAATHRLDASIQVPPADSRLTGKDAPATFRLARCYPDAATSRRLVRGLFAPPPRGLPFRNPGFWPLAGTAHALGFLALLGTLGLLLDHRPVEALRVASLRSVLDLALQGGIWFVVGLTLWSLRPLRHRRRPRGPSLVSLAVALQVLVGFAGLALWVWVAWPGVWPDWAVLGLALVGTGFVTGLVGCYAFGLYLALARRGQTFDWQMSAQAIEDHKGFLRMRVDADGALTLYPLVVDTVCHDWRLEASPGPEQTRALPVTPPSVRLVEAPFVVRRRPAD